MDLLICLYIYLSIWLSYSIFIITILVNWDFQLQWWNISYVIRYVISENIISAPYSYCRNRASQVALVVKHLPANAGDERDVGSIPGGWEDPLEKEMATHSRILVGKFHGQRSLTDHRPWVAKIRKLSDTHTCYRLTSSLMLINYLLSGYDS